MVQHAGSFTAASSPSPTLGPVSEIYGLGALPLEDRFYIIYRNWTQWCVPVVPCHWGAEEDDIRLGVEDRLRNTTRPSL